MKASEYCARGPQGKEFVKTSTVSPCSTYRYPAPCTTSTVNHDSGRNPAAPPFDSRLQGKNFFRVSCATMPVFLSDKQCSWRTIAACNIDSNRDQRSWGSLAKGAESGCIHPKQSQSLASDGQGRRQEFFSCSKGGKPLTPSMQEHVRSAGFSRSRIVRLLLLFPRGLASLVHVISAPCRIGKY
jgi:hypothetical protein